MTGDVGAPLQSLSHLRGGRAASKTRRNTHVQAPQRQSTRSTAGWAKTSGVARNLRSTSAPTAPASNGQRRKSKVSDFGLQLKAKQKLKGYYGNLTEKQFSRTYEEAARRKGNTSENLVGLLESRLDAVVYRAKFVPTVFAARQFVNHGHVLVNGKRVNIASYRVKAGDTVSVRERSRNMALVLEAIQSARARYARLPAG